MCRKKGFLLLSFLVYLMLFSMVTFFINHLITKLIIPSFASLIQNKSIIALHIASDVFVRDIKRMQKGTYRWKTISPHELVWQIDDLEIGWYFSKSCLKRKEEIHNSNGRHIKKSMIAKDVKDAVFVVERDQTEVIGLELIMKPQCAPEKIIKSYISIRKKI